MGKTASLTVLKNKHVLNGQEKELYQEFLSLLGGKDLVDVHAQAEADAGAVVLTARTIRPLHTHEMYEGVKDLLPMDYSQVEKLILHLGIQMRVLAKYQTGLCGFTLDAISVIDEEFFLLTDLQQVRELKKIKEVKDRADRAEVKAEQLLAFTYPMKFTLSEQQFFAPELREKLVAKILPFTTTVSVGYYSLAKLCLACLQLEHLEPLQGSKLYYFLERCLHVEPTEREFLFI
jgi:hypothetical protein